MTDHPEDEGRQIASPSEDMTRHAEAIVKGLAPPPPPPLSTYRVQLNSSFTFRDATRIVPYLAKLGIGALYTSPFLKAHPGSTHGYDVVDYNQLNPEIGTEEDFDRLCAVLREHEMGLLVDFVPNHMGIASGANPWWQDVLENGQSSVYAEYFDIDWAPLQSAATDKIVLPVLGDHYGAVLENGELRLSYEGGTFTVHYYQLPLPIAPPSYAQILNQALPKLETALDSDEPRMLEFQSIIAAFERLPPQSEQDPERLAERHREQVISKRRLADLVASSPDIASAIEETVTEINGTAGDPRSFDALDALLEVQSYRLSFWRVAAEEINYRRFFAINELAALRQEVPEVFATTHALILRLIGEGKISGLRIDHPDGLLDPAGYYGNLQRATFLARCRARFDEESVGAPWEEIEPALIKLWTEQPQDQRFYVVVEKILEPGEELPPSWQVAGTVGYEFARATTGLLVDSTNRKAFDAIYERFTGDLPSFHDLVYEKKQLMMDVALASEVNVLAEAINRISEQDRHTRDFTLNSLRFAVREIIASFPIYRTYVTCEDEPVINPSDRRYIERAVTLAKRRNPGANTLVLDFVRDVLLLRDLERLTPEQRDERCRFSMKFQQLTGPVMAKGLEDTALYIDMRLAALNEVGGDPTAFGIAPDEFYKQCLERRKRWPYAVLSSSTHDTKRSEDVRARLAALSEMPREWRTHLNRWKRVNRKHKRRIEGMPAPSANDEYLLYQTLLGAWPVGAEQSDDEFSERMIDYALKAAREAQVETTWVNPNSDYEEALTDFIRALLDPGNTAFLDDFLPLQRKVAQAGIVNSLAQQVLKLTAPGVPDIYQGTETWDLSLVDPDNRRPVDYDARRKMLDAIKRSKDKAPFDEKTAKILVTERALTARRTHPDLLLGGDFIPLSTEGTRQGNLVAFARRTGDKEAIVVTPRLSLAVAKPDESLPIGELWGETRIKLDDASTATRYRDLFTGATIEAHDGYVRCADLFATLPVAMLMNTDVNKSGRR